DEMFATAVHYGHDVGDTAHPNRLVGRASAGTPEYHYDNSGRLTVDPALGTLTYDERNRLVRIDKPDGVRLEFSYDHNDRRVATRKTDSTGTQQKFEVESIYLIEPGRTVKIVFDEDKCLAVVPSVGDPLLHHLDRIGNVNVLSNLHTGAFTGQYEYTPFG